MIILETPISLDDVCTLVRNVLDEMRGAVVYTQTDDTDLIVFGLIVAAMPGYEIHNMDFGKLCLQRKNKRTWITITGLPDDTRRALGDNTEQYTDFVSALVDRLRATAQEVGVPLKPHEPLTGRSETSSSIVSSGDHNINVIGGVQGGITANYSGAPPVEPVARPQEEYDLEAVRELLGAAFSDQEIVTLASDRFRQVYEDLTGEMSKTTKILRLVDWCNERLVLDDLLAAVEQRNPNQYARYAARLKRR